MFLKCDPYRVLCSIFYSKLVNCILLRSLFVFVKGRGTCDSRERNVIYRIGWSLAGSNAAKLFLHIIRSYLSFWLFVFKSGIYDKFITASWSCDTGQQIGAPMFLKCDPYRVWCSIFYSKLVNCILLRSLFVFVKGRGTCDSRERNVKIWIDFRKSKTDSATNTSLFDRNWATSLKPRQRSRPLCLV
jgi:hypothetical protein